MYLKKDSTIIKYNLIIPRNYTVKIIDNQSIKLVNNAFIFSYSNWEVKSSEKNKIYIGGEDKNFGVVYILIVKKKIILKM